MTKEIETWLRAHGYVDEQGGLAKCWSCRDGYDRACLRFYPLEHLYKNDQVDAIFGHHASGTNPRVILGTCRTLDEVKMVHETVRLTNGYPEPQGDQETR